MEYLHSPDNVPWIIKSYNPWDITKITTMLSSVVLSGKRDNLPGLLLVTPCAFTKILTMSRLFSAPWNTELGFTVHAFVDPVLLLRFFDPICSFFALTFLSFPCL